MEAIHNVISMYYPDFKNIKITKNFLGKIKTIEKNGKLLDHKSFQDLYKRLWRIGETKLSISNQIYEISRLQFVLQQICSSKQIAFSHSQGIPLQISQSDPSQYSEQQTMKLDVSVHPEKQIDPSSLNEKNHFKNLLPNSTSKLNRTHTQSEKILVITTTDDSIQQLPAQPVLKDSDFELLMIQETVCNQDSGEAPFNHEQQSS